MASSSRSNEKLSAYRPYHWAKVLGYADSGTNIETNLENVHQSPEDLNTHFNKSRARAESARKSKDVTKVRTLALEQLHPEVIAQLRENGAFQLPTEEIRDRLVDAFFQWAAPLVPVLNRDEFIQAYQDPSNKPSLLLMQAVLAAGSTVACGSNLSANPETSVPLAATYFDRARMLYEANCEVDPVTLVQALILMGWYWEALDGVAHKGPLAVETLF